MIKKLYIIGLLILCICSLTSCSINKEISTSDGSTALERYSITSTDTENVLPTRLLDLSFLGDKEQLLIDSIWLDQERLLVLTANPAEEGANGQGTLPQNLFFYILNTGDDSLELIYQGQHMAGKLQKLSDNMVAVQSDGNILEVDYNKGIVTKEFNLDIDSDQTADLAISPTGDLMAYSDDKGNLRLLDDDGNKVGIINPKSLGYNWLSSPVWSKNGDAVAFFCGYEQFGVDSIGILTAKDLTTPYLLKYTKSDDSFPAWPHDNNTILVLNNFHIPAKATKSSIQVINWQQNKPLSTFLMPDNLEFASLAYANPTKNIYYLIINNGLFLVNETGTSPQQLNPANTTVYDDNVDFSTDANRIAINKTDENGYLTGIYIIGLSPNDTQ